MTNYKIGDVVQLKSGGPLMTVHAIKDFSTDYGINPGLLCVWFNENKKITDVFHPDAVELWEAPNYDYDYERDDPGPDGWMGV